LLAPLSAPRIPPPPRPPLFPYTTLFRSTTTTATTVPGPSTTVTVDMNEYHFALSQTTVPQGNVTFVIRNVGQQTHNFDLQGKHRSEEHTSELQSQSNLVCRLLLEKKNNE